MAKEAEKSNGNIPGKVQRVISSTWVELEATLQGVKPRTGGEVVQVTWMH